MGDNLPPGVSVSDLPGNDARDPEDLLPLTCSECGFTADTVDDMEDHEHDVAAFAPEHDPHGPPPGARTWDDVKEDPTPTEQERYGLEAPPSERSDDADQDT